MGDDNIQTREVSLTEDQWIYLQNKLESILETEKDDKLEIISATIFADLVGLFKTTDEEWSESKWAIEFLESLDEVQLKELLRTAALITDPLSQELLKKASQEGM